MVDSIFYLSNNLVSGATFGDIEVPALGNFVWFAKYVDTSFMTPYVPGDTGEVRIVMVEDTASGKQHTLKLLKQSDRFGD